MKILQTILGLSVLGLAAVVCYGLCLVGILDISLYEEYITISCLSLGLGAMFITVVSLESDNLRLSF